jgi:hypothetical protein
MAQFQLQGTSSNRPPLFDGVNYGFWKIKLKIHAQAIDPRLWTVITEGSYEFVKECEDGKKIAKDDSELTDAEVRLKYLDSKAMNILYCALDANEFNRISTCTTAKEIWDKLRITHEGTSQVRELRISLLMHEFECFKMDEGETITQMYTRFTNITNPLVNLGKVFTSSELNWKILRAVLPQFQSKVDAIEENENFSRMTVDDIIGKLMAKEISLRKNGQPEKPAEKNKGIALKTSESVEEIDEEANEEEIVMLTRKLERLTARSNRFSDPIDRGPRDRTHTRRIAEPADRAQPVRRAVPDR